MKRLVELARALGWSFITPPAGGDAAVTGAYAGDLLSDVAAGARPGELWLTVQLHPNVARVAVLKDLAGVVICGDRDPTRELVDLALEHELSLLRAPVSLFVAAGRLYREMGSAVAGVPGGGADTEGRVE